MSSIASDLINIHQQMSKYRYIRLRKYLNIVCTNFRIWCDNKYIDVVLWYWYVRRQHIDTSKTTYRHKDSFSASPKMFFPESTENSKNKTIQISESDYINATLSTWLMCFRKWIKHFKVMRSAKMWLSCVKNRSHIVDFLNDWDEIYSLI